MCGLCGVVTFNNSLAQQHILSMNASLIHRGPDDEGYLLGDFNSGRSVQASGSDTPSDLELNPIVDYRNGDFNLALGFRRLSIIDLSPKGHGPMSYANQNFWIVFNGEIYNYIEIRRELSSLGYIFDSNTDTEVILAAYAEWGVECLQHFNGMWAFAIWNVRERKLFCARDRFGIKPFNYFWDGKLFAFASEAKALFQHPSINPQSNDKVVFDYLVYGSQNHGSETFFHGIETVPASHYLELDLARGQVQIQKWWDIELNSERVSSNEKGDARVKTQFRELLTDSIRLRLRSDVPIGSSLSGGLDSSAVVGIVNQLLREEQLLPKDLIGEHQQTFSACFEDGDINERPYIEQVVQRTGVNPHYVYPEGRQGMWQEIDKIHWHQEQPVATSSVYSQWSVMRLARDQHVKVLLDGQGADELLAGYSYYHGTFLSELLRQGKLSYTWRSALSAAINSRENVSLMLTQALYHIFPRTIQQFAMGVANRYFRTNTTLSSRRLRQSLVANRQTSYRLKGGGQDSLPGHLRESIFIHSLPALLHYADRNSMAFSREARFPFLDYRLVELVFSLDQGYRIRNGWTKWLLRESTSTLVPDEIRWRKGKLGFVSPEARWLADNTDLIRRTFSSRELRSSKFLNDKTLKKLQGLTREEARVFPGLWRVLSLEYWMRNFL